MLNINEALLSLQEATDSLLLLIEQSRQALTEREAEMAELTGDSERLGRIESDIKFIREQLSELQSKTEQLAVAADRAAMVALEVADTLSITVKETAAQHAKDTAKIAANLELARQQREIATLVLPAELLAETPKDPVQTAAELAKAREDEDK